MKLNAIISSLIICFLGIALIHQCNKNKSLKDINEVTIEIDTILQPGKIDTVYYPKVEVVTKWLKPKKIKEIEIIKGDTIKTFETNIKDSLLDVKIISKVRGDLLNTKFSYIKNFPKYIYRVDTLRINEKKTIVKKKMELYLGTIIGGNEKNFLIQPSVLLKNKKNTQYHFGYELINKTYNFGIYKKINNPFKK